jgi:hypothetical protein
MLAIIPSIGRSPRLGPLVRTLVDEGVRVRVVDNSKDAPSASLAEILSDAHFGDVDEARLVLDWRPGQGIYRTWNEGLDAGFDRGENVLVLNDDVVIAPGAAAAIEKILVDSGFAIVSFFDPGLPNQVELRPKDPRTLLAETSIPAAAGVAHGLCGYAFAANPARASRCDERFIWYCGDQDFFYSTAASGQRIGIAHSVEVLHLENEATSGTPRDVVDAILPEGWCERDVALITEKWTKRRDAFVPGAALGSGEKPHLFVAIPSLGGKMSAALYRWLTSLKILSATGQLPFVVTEGILEGVAPVHYARNMLAGMGLGTPADLFLYVDDDMLPDETTVRLILAMPAEVDVMAARMYRFRHSGPNALTERERARPPEIACCATTVEVAEDGTEDRKDYLFRRDDTRIIKVDAAGTGCLAIRRRVLEDERMRVGPSDDDGTPAIFRMVSTATGRITEWEDVDFTLRATRLGYVVAVDTGAHCGHRKAVNLDAVAELVLAEKPEGVEA